MCLKKKNYFYFSVFTMTKFFNIDIENIITDYDLSYQNVNDNFMSQIKQLNNDLMKIYTHKIEESKKLSSMLGYVNGKMYISIFLLFFFFFLDQLSDINNQITEDRGKLQLIVEKVECDQQTIHTENNRLESFYNESKLLEVEENELKDVIHQNKVELTHVSKGI